VSFVSSPPHIKQAVKANAFIGKLIDQNFHVLKHDKFTLQLYNFISMSFSPSLRTLCKHGKGKNTYISVTAFVY